MGIWKDIEKEFGMEFGRKTKWNLKRDLEGNEERSWKGI